MRQWIVVCLAALAVGGCAGSESADAPQAKATSGASSELVVYCGRSEALVGPLLEQFTAETGIAVSPRYGKTPALATQLLTEGADSPADLIFAQDSGYLGALSQKGLLSELPEPLLAKVDTRFRDPAGRWLGTSGRARVLVYSTSNVAEGELPHRLEDLASPAWKGRIGWAPTNSSFQAHVSYLRHHWGEEKTREWLSAVHANEPRVYPKNSPQVQAAIDREIHVGWVNHYYLHRKGPDVPAANYSFRENHDAGNVLMVAGVGVREGSPHRDAALRLVEFLVSKTGQDHFAQETFEYPTVPGVPTHEVVPSLESLNLADVDQAYLADVGPTLTMLQELGIL